MNKRIRKILTSLLSIVSFALIASTISVNKNVKSVEAAPTQWYWGDSEANCITLAESTLPTATVGTYYEKLYFKTTYESDIWNYEGEIFNDSGLAYVKDGSYCYICGLPQIAGKYTFTLYNGDKSDVYTEKTFTITVKGPVDIDFSVQYYEYDGFPHAYQLKGPHSHLSGFKVYYNNEREVPTDVGHYHVSIFRDSDEIYDECGLGRTDNSYNLIIGYKLSFNANTTSETLGSVPDPIIRDSYCNYVTIPGCTLARTGYTLDGWNTKPDGTGETFGVTGGITITHSLTLYAMWKHMIITQPSVDNDFIVSTFGSDTTYQWYKVNENHPLNNNISEILNGAGVALGDGVYASTKISGSYYIGLRFTNSLIQADNSGKYVVYFKTTANSLSYSAGGFNAYDVSALDYTAFASTEDTLSYVPADSYAPGKFIALKSSSPFTISEAYVSNIDYNEPIEGETTQRLGSVSDGSEYFCRITSSSNAYCDSDKVTPVCISYYVPADIATYTPVLAHKQYQLSGRSVSLVDGSGFTLPTGTYFKKWNTNSTYTGTFYDAGDNYVISSDINLYAQVGGLYTLTIIVNGETVASITKKSGETVNLSTYQDLVDLDDQLFVNFKDQNENKYSLTDTVTLTSNIELTAIYKTKENPVITISKMNQSFEYDGKDHAFFIEGSTGFDLADLTITYYNTTKKEYVEVPRDKGVYDVHMTFPGSQIHNPVDMTGHITIGTRVYINTENGDGGVTLPDSYDRYAYHVEDYITLPYPESSSYLLEVDTGNTFYGWHIKGTPNDEILRYYGNSKIKNDFYNYIYVDPVFVPVSNVQPSKDNNYAACCDFERIEEYSYQWQKECKEEFSVVDSVLKYVELQADLNLVTNNLTSIDVGEGEMFAIKSEGVSKGLFEFYLDPSIELECLEYNPSTTDYSFTDYPGDGTGYYTINISENDDYGFAIKAKNGNKIELENTHFYFYEFRDIPGQNNATLADVDSNTQYRCKISNDYGVYVYTNTVTPKTVTLVTDGGILPNYEAYCLEGRSLDLSKHIPTKARYEFLGWATTQDGDVAYSPDEKVVIDDDMTLYAKYFVKNNQFSGTTISGTGTTEDPVVVATPISNVVTGDTYLNISTFDMYAYNGTNWVFIGNIKGADGKTIVSVTKTSTSGLVDTYTILYNDTTTSTFTVTNGANGSDGADGVTPTITISTDGYWVINGVKSSTQAVGKDGVNGTNGQDGQDGAAGQNAIAPQIRINSTTNEWEISIDGGTTWTSTGVKATGANGQDGADGKSVVSIAKTSSEGLVDTYTITYSDNSTSTFTVTNGANGQDGQDGQDGAAGQNGQDGTTPVITISTDGYWEINGVKTSTVAIGKDGTNGTNGQDGQNGQDGAPGQNAIAPQISINATTNEWQISVDGGTTWSSTGVKATGAAGQNGTNGTNGADGSNGKDGINGKDGTNLIWVVAVSLGVNVLLVGACAYFFISNKKKHD